MSRACAFVLLFCLLCGCAAGPLPDSAPAPSAPPAQSSEPLIWDGLYDLAGNSFDFSQKDTVLNNFEVDYALGWMLDDSQYQTIREGDTVAGYTVEMARSSYSINTFEVKPPSTIADTNEYSLDIKEPINGVLVFSAEELAFFPYYREDGENFLLLCEATDNSKQLFTQRSSLAIDDGQTILIQPIRVALSDSIDIVQKLCAAVSGKTDCDPAFRESLIKPAVMDVTLQCRSLCFYTFSQGRGGGMWGTRAYAIFDDERNATEQIVMNKAIGTTETDTVWTY